MLVSENAAEVVQPLRGDRAQDRVFVADFLAQRNHFANRDDAHRDVQIRHRVNKAFARVQHVHAQFGRNHRDVRALDRKHAHQRSVVTFDCRAVLSQTLKRQKIRHLRFARFRQNHFAQFCRQQSRERRRRDDAQNADQNLARSQTLDKDGKNTFRKQVSFLCTCKCSSIRRRRDRTPESSRTNAARAHRTRLKRYAR